MIDIIDTIPLMASDDYKERFIAEYIQTRTRYLKLIEFLIKWDNGELGFNPDCPKLIYDYQIKTMKQYLDILEVRAKIENIDLSQVVR